MKGISKQPQPYTCEIDLANPKEERTTFWILPQKVADSAKMMSGYNSAFERSVATGKDNIEPSKWIGATKQEFLSILSHVDNYCFSEDAENVPQGFTDIKADETELKEKLFYDLPNNIVQEIIRAAGTLTSVTPKNKKKLS